MHETALRWLDSDLLNQRADDADSAVSARLSHAQDVPTRIAGSLP
jgi:hypothetical protein